MTSLIYRLVDGSGLVYIGSTDLTLKERLKCHLSDYKRWTFGKTAKLSWYDILEPDKIKIELVEICETEKRNDRETWYLRNTENINKYKSAKLTREEKLQQRKNYHTNHRENNLQLFQNYYIENKEKLREKRCQVITCKCGKSFTLTHKSAHEKSLFHIKKMLELIKNE